MATPEDDFQPPSLEGRWARLRLIQPQDYPDLYEALIVGETGMRWRFRGPTPSPESFVAQLWQGTLAQFAVETVATGSIVGVVSAMAFDPEGRTAHVGIASLTMNARIWPIEALAILLTYCFTCWDLRKVYGRVPEFNYRQFSSGQDRYFDLEGTLREHLYFDGRYWDEQIISITRERWRRSVRPAHERLMASSQRGQEV